MSEIKDYKGLILMSLIFIFSLIYISFIGATVTTTLNSPTDGFNNTLNTVTFNCSANSDGFVTNISLYTNSTGTWHRNQTIYSKSFSGTPIIYSGGTINNSNSSANPTNAFDYNDNTYSEWSSGSVGDTTNLIALGLTFSNISVNYIKVKLQITQSTFGSANYRIETYDGSNWNNITSWTSVSNGANVSSNITINNFVQGIRVAMDSTTSGGTDSGSRRLYTLEYTTYNPVTQTFSSQVLTNTKWNCYSCDNNSVCSYATSNRTVGFDTILNSITYNTTSYETSTETYSTNITPTGYTPTNAYLVYNGTSYAATITPSGSSYILSKSLTLSSSNIGANSFYFVWNYSSSGTETTSTYTQTVSPIQFGLCNATLTVPYLNISFKDEDDSSVINGTISSSTFNYYLGNGTSYKTYTYSVSTNTSSYTFCTLPANKTYYLDIELQYKLGSVYDAIYYPQRTWNPDVTSYTNSTTNQTLYLLSSEDGQDVTFQVLNVAGQTIEGVSVEAYRVSGSSQVFVASGTTGGSGSVTFFLNKNYEHIINFTKTGYTQYTFDEPPTQTTYTITLASSTASAEDYRQGIRLSKTPINSSVEENSVNDFTFTISSDKYTLVNFTATLYFGNGTLISSDSSTTGTGGTITFSNINVTNQSIYMYYNWSINTSTLNGVYYWINSGTEGREFSIWNFFKDFNDYSSESNGGLFGLDDFGRGILAVIFIVLVVGTMGYRYGIQSEPMVLGMIFGIVLFLDTMNFIPKPDILGIAPLDNFLTIITALILIGFVIREEMR